MDIGNRLKYIVSFLRYFHNPSRVLLVWQNTGWVSSSFYDLFQFNSPEIKIIETNRLVNIQPFVCPCNWRLYVAPDDEKPVVNNNDPYDKNKYRIDFLYNNTPQHYLNIYDEYFNYFMPSDKVQKILNKVVVKENMIAVQIRDNKDWNEWGRASYINEFIAKMKTYPKDTKFFLSAMNKEVSLIINETFKGQIIEIPDKDYNSMIYAAADMFLLSVPMQALCSCGSTFYEVSWWFNRKHPFVQVVGSYDNWRKFR